jgi:hypothetical protein
LFRVCDGILKRKELIAVAEAIGCDIEHAHDEGAFADGKCAAASNVPFAHVAMIPENYPQITQITRIEKKGC